MFGKKDMVEDCEVLRVKTIYKEIKDGLKKLSSGETPADLAKKIAELMSLKITVGEGKDAFSYNISYTTTPCHYGGSRLWFICPSCGNRAGVLYQPSYSKYYLCRDCQQLTYESRQRHKDRFYEAFVKPLDRLRKIEASLKKKWLRLDKRLELLHKYKQLVAMWEKELEAYNMDWKKRLARKR